MVIPFRTWSVLDHLPPNMALWNAIYAGQHINMSDEGENNPLTPQQQMEQQMEVMQKFMEKQMQVMPMPNAFITDFYFPSKWQSDVTNVGYLSVELIHCNG